MSTKAHDSAIPAPARLRKDAQTNLDRVLHSARAVFAAHGLEAKLVDVARHAGVGVGTVYRRFGSKDQLIEHLFASRMQDVVALAEAAAKVSDPWEGLVQFLEDSTLMMAEDRGLRDLVINNRAVPAKLSEPGPPDGLAGVVDQMRDEIHTWTILLVDRAKEAGALRADFEATDIPVVSLSIQAVADFAGPEAPDVWKRVLGFAIDGLRASRTGHTELAAPALTGQQVKQALQLQHGFPI